MLDSISTLNGNILALPRTADQLTGVRNFVKVVADFTNQVQAGSNGKIGIVIFSNSSMETILLTQRPVQDNTWITNFANAWEAGITNSVIIPGTVTDPIWQGSSVDTRTLPSASSTIITIAAAKQILISKLQDVTYVNAAIPISTAIYDATVALQFLCIGLGPAPTHSPISVVFNAQ